MEKINVKENNEKYILKPSTRKNKKYMIMPNNSSPVHFGAKGMSDFTIHKDEKRKQRYINRHKKNEQNFWTHTK